MEQCKIAAGKGSAILWSDGLPQKSRLTAILQQNTFWNAEAGMAVEAPLTAEDIQLVMRNNVFYQVKNVLQVDASKAKMKPEALTGGLTGGGNVFDLQGSKPGDAEKVAKFGIKGHSFTLNTDASKPTEFLRYGAESPLRLAGENQTATGAND
jgi:hypothetical protein